MAFINQEEKAKIAPVVKAILKKHGLKGSLSIQNHSTLNLTIKSGKIDFIKNLNETVANRPGGFRNGSPVTKGNLDVNVHWIAEHFSGKALAALEELIPALKGQGWFNHSDVQSDYFHQKHYFGISVGRWDKDYILEA